MTHEAATRIDGGLVFHEWKHTRRSVVHEQNDVLRAEQDVAVVAKDIARQAGSHLETDITTEWISDHCGWSGDEQRRINQVGIHGREGLADGVQPKTVAPG
jgi:hypothetical protein